jgi:nitrite reductase (NADH) large subunit
MMSTYVILGNGVAGATAAESIRKLDSKGKITLLTEEDFPFYYRIRLNEYISGDIQEEALKAKKDGWYGDQGIELRLKSRVVGGDPVRKVVVTEDKQELPYDMLLLATGSHSFIPPIKGWEKWGVFALRSIKDAREISAWAKNTDDVVLIGGGLLGLEAGNALRKLGLKVMVVEFFPRLLPRQLDVDGARRLQDIMQDMGFSFRLGAKTQEIKGDGRIDGVILEGGETLSAQMVIISAGVRPNMELAGPLALDTDKGIKVDERLRTSQPNIYAAGDVAEFRGVPYGIWPAAMEQGKIAGTNMAGGDLTYNGTTMANTLKVVGVDLASAGDIDADQKFESKVVKGEKTYKKIVLDNDRIIGCIMLGDTKGFTQVTKIMSEKRDVSQVKDRLLSEGFDFKSL